MVVDHEAPPEYLTMSEATNILRVHRNTLLSWIQKGEIQVVKKERTILIPYEEVFPLKSEKGGQVDGNANTTSE